MSSGTASTKQVSHMSWLSAIILVVALGGSYVLSSYWWIFLLAGSVFTVASFFASKEPFFVVKQKALSQGPGGVDMPTDQFLIPQTWDRAEIAIQVRKLQSNAGPVGVFVDSVLKRFVIGQDNHTARVRIEFLKSKLEELTLSKGLQASLDELQLRKLNLEIQQLELEKKKSTLQLETKRQQVIFDLERERDVLKIRVEIAGLQKQMDEMRSPVKELPSRSSEEIKREKKQKKEQEIRECEEQIKQVQTDSSLSEETRRRKENILSKKLDALFEELEQYI